MLGRFRQTCSDKSSSKRVNASGVQPSIQQKGGHRSKGLRRLRMNIRQILAVGALAAVSAIPATSDAQYRPGNRGSTPRHDNRNESEIYKLVVHAERQSNQFRQRVERGWDSRQDRRWGRDWDN